MVWTLCEGSVITNLQYLIWLKNSLLSRNSTVCCHVYKTPTLDRFLNQLVAVSALCTSNVQC